MKITDVRVRTIDKEDIKMKAVASITIDGEFVIHDIKVIESDKGLFIAMPSKRDGEGKFKDICHPIKTETRNEIQEMILKKYEEVLASEE